MLANRESFAELYYAAEDLRELDKDKLLNSLHTGG
jgi:hypothetical protein